MNCGGGRDTVADMLRAGALALAAAFVCAAPADGAYPGRNGRVAYVESALGRTGSGWGPTIVSVRLDGTGRQTLTTATRTSGDFEPAWSPDAAGSRTSTPPGVSSVPGRPALRSG